MTIEVGSVGAITPPVEGLVRIAKRNEARGYDAMWWPDHLMGLHHTLWSPDITPLARTVNPHAYLDPIAAISAAAMHTERMRLGTAVTEPVRRHPAMIANEWLSLDHITKGRAVLGIGAGEAENITPYGMSFARPVARLEESLAIIRLLWEADGPVDFDGEFWKMRGAVCGLGPYEPGRFPPIWIGANGPRMLEIAGRYGDGWLPTVISPAEYERRLGVLRDAARRAGRDPGAITPGMSHYVLAAEDHQDCHRMMEHPLIRAMMLSLSPDIYAAHGHEHPLGGGSRGLVDYIPTHETREEALKAIERVPPEVTHQTVFHGTPDEVAATIMQYVAVGLRHFSMLNVSPLADPSRARESYALTDAVLDLLKAAR